MNKREEREGLALAREFNRIVINRKKQVILYALEVYYNDLENTGITIPNFLNRNNYKRRAKQHLNLLLKDKKVFEETYKMCSERYKNLLT